MMITHNRFIPLFYTCSLGCLLTLAGCNHQSEAGSVVDRQPGKDYPVYGGNYAGNRFSPLQQITKENVSRLEVAWIYDARDSARKSGHPGSPREIQCQPIVVNGTLYGTNAQLDLFALDPATGKIKWQFLPQKDRQRFNTSRGVMYWEDGNDKRIIYSAGASLYAVNAVSGKLISTFGNEGKVDLHEGLAVNLGHDVNNLSVTATTPGVIFKNTLVIGSSVSENGDAAPGHVRGFDVVTGKLKWTFHTIPQPGEFGYDTWPKEAYRNIGAANNWAGMVVDTKRGWVFFGTGSPASDFYGGSREGQNLFANCVLALDAETGKMKWYFQIIHHDLWDRDIPCQPNLATIRQNGKQVEVVVQATKDGLVYVLDRETGVSIYPIEERRVPTTGLKGEHPYPTQKFLSKPLPFSRQVFHDSDITNISPEAHAFVSNKIRDYKGADNKFTPPSATGTLQFGYSGGAEWGGNAIDPAGVLYQNANQEAWQLVMIDKATRDKEIASLSPGNGLYLRYCGGCHGSDRKGSPGIFPSLTGINTRKSDTDIHRIIQTGNGRMPSFQFITAENRKMIVDFLLNRETRMKAKVENEHSLTDSTTVASKGFPYEPLYTAKFWQRLTDQDGNNGTKPPWGTLNAIDLNTGDYLWTVPLGEYSELTKKGVPVTGTENYGGPLVTGSGLLFIAATKDEKIRAFDTKTGKVLWQYQLPAGGFATPITYEVDGRQYICVAAGGARGLRTGGWYVAFRLK